MAKLQLTPDLRRWVVDQARQGQAPAAVVGALQSQGWEEELALDAVQTALHDYLVEHARQNGLPEPVGIPEPMERGGAHLLDGGDRRVAVLGHLLAPRVVILGSVLSDRECDEMVALSRAKLTRSETFLLEEGVSAVHEGRTSEGMFFTRGENELCRRIEARLAALCHWPVENGEGLQVLRYGPGAEYRPHYDYFDPEKPGTAGILEQGGQRVATIVIYLNTPVRGGETTFPDVGLEIAPIKGNAVFFSYDRPHPMTKTLHGGAPVLAGEKWIATKWLRAGAYL